MLSPDFPLAALTVAQFQQLLRDAVGSASATASEDWIDQRSSGVGPKRHAAMVRRRLEAGLPGASKVGRRWLLSREALKEELERREPSAAAGLDAELADLRGAR